MFCLNWLNLLTAGALGCAAALFRRVKGEAVCMMTGGVSHNQGVVQAIEETLGLPLFIHEDAQLCGALGAALFAWEMPAE